MTRQAALGPNFSYITSPALALAEELVRLSPACEAVRFCASGTEATMYCQRLARAFTGRRKILRVRLFAFPQRLLHSTPIKTEKYEMLRGRSPTGSVSGESPDGRKKRELWLQSVLVIHSSIGVSSFLHMEV